MQHWVWTIVLTPIWLLTISCLWKVRKVFILMEKHYEKQEKK